MKRRTMLFTKLLSITLLALAALFLGASGSRAQEPVPEGEQPIAGEAQAVAASAGTAFTYQGQLRQGTTVVRGQCDFLFRLFDAPNEGGRVGSELALSDVVVTNGLFMVELDFGNVINGEARFLEVSVRCPTGAGEFVALAPRQPLRPAPLALALPGLSTRQSTAGPSIIGGYSGNFLAPGVAGATVFGGRQGALNQISRDYGTVSGGASNSVSGFSSVVSGGFANGAGSDYSTIGGGRENRAGAQGNVQSDNTIAGGFSNEAWGVGSTVGGGTNNAAGIFPGPSGQGAITVAGGSDNRAQGTGATVSGGFSNVASGEHSTIAGGEDNAATGIESTVIGGFSNVASGNWSVVAGGLNNDAFGRFSFAGGHNADANHDGSFVWADSTDAALDSTRANQFLVRANGGAVFMRGGLPVPAGSSATLQVEQSGGSGEGVWVWSATAANPHAVLKLLRHPSGNNNFLECENWSGPGTAGTRRCHINRNGTFVSGSDFAEAMPAYGGMEGYEPGDVLVLSASEPGAVERSGSPYDTALAGVYSTNPGVLGAEKDGEIRVDANDLPVAIVGIVPTKVSAENGAIQPGDLLTTASIPGHAMLASAVEIDGISIYPTGAILGKALEPLDSGTGIIRVLVTLR